jgi:hypothetical protein
MPCRIVVMAHCGDGKSQWLMVIIKAVDGLTVP